MATVAIDAAKGIAAPLHRVAPRAAPHREQRVTRERHWDLVWPMTWHFVQCRTEPAKADTWWRASARNPHLCMEGAALKSYADGPGGLALTVL